MSEVDQLIMKLSELEKEASELRTNRDKLNTEAREKAELALAEQKKLTSRWEERARQKGWREGSTKPNVKSKSNVQVA